MFVYTKESQLKFRQSDIDYKNPFRRVFRLLVL